VKIARALLSAALFAAALPACAHAWTGWSAKCADDGSGPAPHELNQLKNRENLPKITTRKSKKKGSKPKKYYVFKKLAITDGTLMQPGDTGAECKYMPKPLSNKRTNWTGTAKDGSDLSKFKACINEAEKRAICVEGYMTKVVRQEAESVNCHKTSTDFKDYHGWVGDNASDPPNKCLIVEVTPRIRNAYDVSADSYNTVNVTTTYKGWDNTTIMGLAGKKVRVYGWQVFDQYHKDSKKKHRFSAWEIHPILYIAVENGKNWEWVGTIPDEFTKNGATPLCE
jgi:hypothetical protein